MRAVTGIEVDEETLAADVIQSVGPDGNYLMQDHTLDHMRTEFFYPVSTDRRSFARWAAEGSLDGRSQARRLAAAILSRPAAACVPEDVEKKILAEIPGLAGTWSG